MKGGLGATQLTEVSKTQKMDTETPAQKQAAAKLALRKQLEKTLLQVLYFEDSFKILQDFNFLSFLLDPPTQTSTARDALHTEPGQYRVHLLIRPGRMRL